ncbi:MAG: Cellulose 1,4-beta-cellobiosidase [Herbinix sp.]|nr:Cellulose 1,4-beta-cellobiosidase [Herbinix sp.]
MGYEANPVYADPGSNTWFGFQAWSMQRVAEYYYKTNDVRAKQLLDKWVSWVKSVVVLNSNGTFSVPSTIDWTGQPDTWTGTYTGNNNLHVTIVNSGTDLGVTASLANALLYYSKASGDDASRVLAKELLDRMWTLYRDDKGLSAPESRADYTRFFEQEVYVPTNWTGKMPNGDVIKSGVKFLDIRSKYKSDPSYQSLLSAYNSGQDPVFNYHRFWAQCDIALANGVYSILFGDGSTPVNNSAIAPTTATFDKKTANQTNVVVTMTLNGNTLTGIKDGSTYLVNGTDYTVSGSTVTLLKAYLATKTVGVLNLTFDFNKGIDPLLAITISDTTPSGSITPTTATFDKKTANQANVVISLTLAGNTLSAIKLDGQTLTSGTNYTVSGSTVTFPASYLATLATGAHTVVFDLSAGIDPTLALTVVDTSVVAGNIKVQMYNGNTSAQTNGIAPRFKLFNTGTTSINLSEVKIRYYYTVDGEKAQNFWCDWSSAGSSNITGTFVKLATAKTNADYYLEIGFTSGAGTLAAGQSIEIQARFSKTDWTNYTQTGDYSYNASGNNYVDWNNSTGYLSNSLKWGIEP